MKAGEWRRKGNFSSSSREGTVGTLFRFSVGDGTRWALSIGRPGYPFQVLGAKKCMPWLELASKVLGLPRPRPTWPVWGQHFCSLSLGIINKVSVDKSTTGSNVRSRSDPLFLRPHDVTFGFTGGERKERNRSSPFQISNSRRRLDDCTHCSLGNQPASSSTGGQDDVMVVERTWS